MNETSLCKACIDIIISEITTQQEIQKGKTTGITENKQNEEDEMIQATVETPATVYAYASLIGDNELLSKVDYSPSYLKNLRDTELKAVCQSVHTAASSVISELDDYGKTQEDLDKLQKEINDFSDMLSQSRKAIHFFNNNQRFITPQIQFNPIKMLFRQLNIPISKLKTPFSHLKSPFSYSNMLLRQLKIPFRLLKMTLRQFNITLRHL